MITKTMIQPSMDKEKVTFMDYNIFGECWNDVKSYYRTTLGNNLIRIDA